MTAPEEKTRDTLSAIASLVILGVIVVGVAYIIDQFSGSPPKVDPVVAAIEAQTKRLDAIDEKLSAITAPKTLTIKADVLTITVIPSENLGVVPPPPPRHAKPIITRIEP